MHYKYEASAEALNTVMYNCCAQMQSLLSIVNARLIEITRFYRTVFFGIEIVFEIQKFSVINCNVYVLSEMHADLLCHHSIL